MKRFTEESLIRAWHGQSTGAMVAKDHKISTRTVKRFWADCRADGRLPDRHRPFFPPPHCVPPVVPGFDSDVIADLELDADMARDEQNYSADRNAMACSASLAALRLAHPDLDNPESHTAPASWFKRAAPSRAELAAMARAFDEQRRSLTIVRKARSTGRLIPESFA